MEDEDSRTPRLALAISVVAATTGLVQLASAAMFALRFTEPFLALSRWFERDGGSAGERLASGLALAVVPGVLAFAGACGGTGLGLLGLAGSIRRRGGAHRAALLVQAGLTLPVPLVLLVLPDLTTIVARSLTLSIDVTRGASLAFALAQVLAFAGAAKLGPPLRR